MSEKKYKIMFVCTGNTCRSPMAEGALRVLLEKEKPGEYEVSSSGTAAATGYPATSYAREAAKMWEVDLSSHVSRPLTEELIDRSDLILAMSQEHLQTILELSPTAAGKSYLFKNFPENNPLGEGVEDPIGRDLSKYNEVFLEIGEYLGKNLSEFVKRIKEKNNA